MSRNRKRKLNVFFCTAREDLPKAGEIYSKLREETWIEPWLYQEDILGGQDWKAEISKAMLKANAIIVCLSKKAADREGYFQSEIKDALEIAKQVPPGNIFILPLKLTECVLPDGIKHLHPLEYFEAQIAYEKLLQSLELRAKSVGVKFGKPLSVKKPEKQLSIDPYTAMPKKSAMLILDEDIRKFDYYRQNVIRYILSQILNIDERHVVIKSFTDGSVKVVIELPEKIYDYLEFLWRSRNRDLLRLFKIISLGVSEQTDAQKTLKETSSGQFVFVTREEEMALEQENFVGGEVELKAFRRLLKNPYGKIRIPFILGSGGIGKTLLIKRMLGEAREFGVLAAEEPIDLFSTDYRHIDGIQWKIKEIIENLPGLEGQSSPFAGFVKGKTDTSEKFYECLKVFCVEHPLVLAFDTFENLDTVASDWLFRSQRGGLQVPGLICIVASRPERSDLDTYRKNPLVQEIPVFGFSLEEAEAFYQEIADEFEDPLEEDLLKAAGIEPASSIQKGIEWIWKVTEGHPLRLEMAFRWSGTLLGEKGLADLTTDKFEEQLMGQMRDLGERGLLDVGPFKVSQPVYDTLLCMAYITRRFDEHFLRYLIDKKLIRLDDPNIREPDILYNLKRYFFVKVRRGSGEEQVIQLHDEMARLVWEYVWPFHDSSGEKKQALLSAVDEYYDQLIGQSSGEEADILRVEQLYYALQRDWNEEGKELWFQLTEMGNENINKLLLGEIKDYIEKYDPQTQYEIQRRIAEIEKDAHHLNQSIGYWDKVWELGEAEKRADWLVDALVGKFNASWQADPEKALKKYLLPAKRLAEASVPEKIVRVYYEIGFAYRQMQDMEKAIQWYEKAIQELPEDLQEDTLNATLRNDIGYVYGQLGRWGYATRYLNAALGVRDNILLTATKQLENGKPEELKNLQHLRSRAAIHVGLSHNTLGEFHRHAEDLDEALTNYNKAYELFQKENNYFWQAKSLDGRGETYRRLALLAKSQNDQSGYDVFVEKARGDMKESLYLCEKYQLDDERDTAYRRLGRLSHDFAIDAYARGEKGSAQRQLEEAYDYFTRGLEFAQKTKEVLEEFENLTELAFLLDDAIAIYGQNKVPAHYKNVLGRFEKALKEHANDKPRIHQFPVFEALLKLEHGAIALSAGNFTKALNHYLEGFKEMGTRPGYGVTRYKQHFPYLTNQIRKLPRDQQVRWCRKFIQTWKETPGGRRGKSLAEELDPDLVQWCDHLLGT